jgi:hypothetical protein
MHNCEFTEIIVQRYSMRPSHKREPNFHRFLVLFPTHPPIQHHGQQNHSYSVKFITLQLLFPAASGWHMLALYECRNAVRAQTHC